MEWWKKAFLFGVYFPDILGERNQFAGLLKIPLKENDHKTFTYLSEFD